MRFILFFLLASFSFAQSSYQAIQSKDGTQKAEDFYDAIVDNVRPECRNRLAPIVAAIRYSENGRMGREYGVLHPKALNKSYRTQAGWCAATVQKNYDRWVAAGSKGDYIAFLGSRYCPLDDPRDTDGLNKHWIGNVTKFAKRFGYAP